MPWRQAVRIAADMDAAAPIRWGLHSAIGAMLAQPVAAPSDLPPVPSADAWIRGARIGPWTVQNTPPTGGAEGRTECPSADGGGAGPRGRPRSARRDGVPTTEPGTDRADRRCRCRAGGRSHLRSPGSPTRDGRPGQGVTEAGARCGCRRPVDQAGIRVTAGTIALAAAAGVDELMIVPGHGGAGDDGVGPARLGPPRRGRNRDIVAPVVAQLGDGKRRAMPPRDRGPRRRPGPRRPDRFPRR